MSTQAIAVQKFLPFCRALLLGGSPAHAHGPLPIQRPKALTAEVLAALEDMINKAVMGWLIRGIGWRSLPIPDDEDVSTARIWNQTSWGDLRLRFTDTSIDLLLLTWNLLAETGPQTVKHTNNRRWRQMSPAQRTQWRAKARSDAVSAQAQKNQQQLATLSLEASGDQLLHHLIFRAIHRRRPVLAELWMHNPLNLMAFYPLPGRRSRKQCRELRALLAGPLAPLLPWITREWPNIWRTLPLPESLVRLTGQWRNQSIVFSAWINACEESDCAHLLVPLIVAYADQAAQLDATKAHLSALVATQPLTTRQPAKQEWASALQPLDAITACHQAAMRTHPVEREGAQRILLTEAARLDLAATRATLQATASLLTDAIG